MIPKLALAALLVFPIAQASDHHHYHDIVGNSLEKFDIIWDELTSFYGDSVPVKITVNFTDGSLSSFDAEHNAINLVPSHYQESANQTVAHETSHLALFHLTNGLSSETAYRFIDEGFAEVISYELVDKGDAYKRQALVIAAQALQAGRISFALVQDWAHYFGEPPNLDWRAYPVGSSFIYFLRDAGGQRKLYDFFATLGKTRDLGNALTQVYGLNLTAAEDGWQKYLANVDLSVVPHVARLIPANGDVSVSTATAEIVAEFDHDMDTSGVCISTPCGDTGLCYSNFHWDSPRRLTIKADKELLPHYSYRLSLGVEGRCLMQSAEGFALDLTPWQFTTSQP